MICGLSSYCRFLAATAILVSVGVPVLLGQNQSNTSADDGKAVAIIIGGVEYAGYSSEAQATDGFLDLFYRGPQGTQGFTNGLSGWTRIRLTSAAQPATNGVVSVISNPTGLTTFNYSNVGQVLDYVFGPSWVLPNTKNWALIADVGGITPLSSQNVPVTFVAPAPGTQECTTLVNRFSPKNGYNPGLSLNTNPNPSTCLAGGYADVAFANQDRSNFLLKYAAGIRTWYKNPFGGCKNQGSTSKCADAYAAVDATLGQDSSVTGGMLRGVVFKVDGVLPIPTGNNSSWLYLFASTYVRLRANENLPPLILQAPASPVTVPSPTVVVLPLVQPNRDYYRLGVGLNISQLWCKTFGSGCSTQSSDTGSNNSVPSVSSLNPPSGTAGATADLPLSVTGSNFVSVSKIKWNDTVLTTTQYVSPSLLTVTVPKANLAKAATVQVTVTNSAPGGGTSNTTAFPIN